MSRPLRRRSGSRLRRRRPPLRLRALRLNRRFSKWLRWRPFLDQIALLTGATSPSPTAFASALQDWQKNQGLPPDGVLGPATWEKMKPALNAPDPPESPSGGAPVVEPEPAPDSGDAAPPPEDSAGAEP